MRSVREDSSMMFILKGLIPYTKQNLMLSFKPNTFFNELEKIDRRRAYRREVLKTSYYRAIDKGYIEYDEQGFPRVTEIGMRQLRVFTPKSVSKDARLLLIFDIPEEKKYKRDRLRRLLKELRFYQVQKSVWISRYDSRDILLQELRQDGIHEFVRFFEAKEIVFS